MNWPDIRHRDKIDKWVLHFEHPIWSKSYQGDIILIFRKEISWSDENEMYIITRERTVSSSGFQMQWTSGGPNKV